MHPAPADPSSAPSPAPTLQYATPPPATLTAQEWRNLFGWGVVYVVVLAALITFKPPGIGRGLRDMPNDPFAKITVLQILIAWGNVLGNALAVAGYWMASLGRSPRRVFQLYMPLQSALVLAMIALAIVMVAKSPFRFTPAGQNPGSFKIIVVPWTAIFTLAMFEVVFSLPLFALLIPKLRRGCFAHD